MAGFISQTSNKNPSIFGGAMIIAGTIIGAGMFSLPIMMAGPWFWWSLVVLVITWFFMFHSGLMILEANLHYHIGSSFNTITKDLLGQGWNIINGITLAFVLYILCYAYISASSAVLHQTFSGMNIGRGLSPSIFGFIFAIIVAFIVWLSTTAVSRITTIVLGAKIITFFLTFGSLFFHVKAATLFDVTSIASVHAHYAPFILVALPFAVTSFGFHGNVSSLMKHYGKKPKTILYCLLCGTLLALLLYVVWLVGMMGNIPRTNFKEIIAQGGNIDVLVAALGHIIHQSSYFHIVITLFSNFAVACSFLGVSLGLFDYIADLFKLPDSRLGRLKSAVITFVPPVIGGVLFPNGFIYAIGFAGLAATIWAVIVPALMVNKSRKVYDKPLYKVWGGHTLIVLVILFGIVAFVAQVLSACHYLPVFS